ncbi:MAG: glycosyltransferase family 2 protein [Flavobacterium sp.]|nr:MAG: glycosyltransferase family 2 protein [Flavobacterium sp.]
MATVSVIVPNFNHSKYLKQRIDSILDQTFTDFEVILLDDCSTDNSKSILDTYIGHPKVSHLVYNQFNSGSPFKQWKKGIDISNGAYIWIAESDDWCEPTLLETLMEGMRKDEQCVISYCQSFSIDDEEKIIFQSNHSRLSEMIDGQTFIEHYLSVPVAIFNASMVLWKKDKFEQIPHDYMNYKFCGDWLFWIYLSRLGKVNISAKALNYFRKHKDDVSGKAYKTGLNFVEELEIINKIYSEDMISESTYYKAFRKKFIGYWLVKGTIDNTNRSKIKALFNSPLSTKANQIKFLPSAIWKRIRTKTL